MAAWHLQIQERMYRISTSQNRDADERKLEESARVILKLLSEGKIPEKYVKEKYTCNR